MEIALEELRRLRWELLVCNLLLLGGLKRFSFLPIRPAGKWHPAIFPGCSCWLWCWQPVW